MDAELMSMVSAVDAAMLGERSAVDVAVSCVFRVVPHLEWPQSKGTNQRRKNDGYTKQELPAGEYDNLCTDLFGRLFVSRSPENTPLNEFAALDE